MITDETLTEIILGTCSPLIENHQVEPKHAIACLLSAIGRIAISYEIHPEYSDEYLNNTITNINEKFKDHFNWDGIM